MTRKGIPIVPSDLAGPTTSERIETWIRSAGRDATRVLLHEEFAVAPIPDRIEAEDIDNALEALAAAGRIFVEHPGGRLHLGRASLETLTRDSRTAHYRFALTSIVNAARILAVFDLHEVLANIIGREVDHPLLPKDSYPSATWHSYPDLDQELVEAALPLWKIGKNIDRNIMPLTESEENHADETPPDHAPE
jgi:hypothetical protein